MLACRSVTSRDIRHLSHTSSGRVQGPNAVFCHLENANASLVAGGEHFRLQVAAHYAQFHRFLLILGFVEVAVQEHLSERLAVEPGLSFNDPHAIRRFNHEVYCFSPVEGPEFRGEAMAADRNFPANLTIKHSMRQKEINQLSLRLTFGDRQAKLPENPGPRSTAPLRKSKRESLSMPN